MCTCKKHWFQLGKYYLVIVYSLCQSNIPEHAESLSIMVSLSIFSTSFSGRPFWSVSIDWRSALLYSSSTFSIGVGFSHSKKWISDLFGDSMKIAEKWWRKWYVRKARSRPKKHWDICAKILRVKIKKSKLNENHLNWRVPLKLIQVPDWIM